MFRKQSMTVNPKRKISYRPELGRRKLMLRRRQGLGHMRAHKILSYFANWKFEGNAKSYVEYQWGQRSVFLLWQQVTNSTASVDGWMDEWMGGCMHGHSMLTMGIDYYRQQLGLNLHKCGIHNCGIFFHFAQSGFGGLKKAHKKTLENISTYTRRFNQRGVLVAKRFASTNGIFGFLLFTKQQDGKSIQRTRRKSAKSQN
jgi:hypothetical protein